MASPLLDTALIGIGATVTMDLFTLGQKHLLRQPTLDYAMVGRWLGHLPNLRLIHRPITASPNIPHERALGWAAHYLIGLLFAFNRLFFFNFHLGGINPAELNTRGHDQGLRLFKGHIELLENALVLMTRTVNGRPTACQLPIGAGREIFQRFHVVFRESFDHLRRQTFEIEQRLFPRIVGITYFYE